MSAISHIIQFYSQPCFSNTKCDLCSSTIVGRRTTCLSCVSDDYSSLVDLCIDCSKIPVRTALFSHVPAHDMIQVGQIIHDRDKSSLLSTAKGAAIKGRLAMEDSQRKIDGGAASGPILECSWCGNSVSLLCWFCIACSMSIAHQARRLGSQIHYRYGNIHLRGL